MKLVKAFGLALLAVVAVVAFIQVGTDSTHAEGEKKIVLCKKGSVTVCPNETDIWVSNKIVTAEAVELTVLGAIKEICTEVKLVGPVAPKMGSELTWTVIAARIQGCEGPCQTVRLDGLPAVAKVKAEPSGDEDTYWLLLPLKIKAVCTGGVTCVFSSHAKVEIVDPNVSGQPKLFVKNVPMTLVSGSKLACGTTNTLDGFFYLTGGALTILYALFELTAKEQEEQAVEEKHEEELHGKEWHEEELKIEEEYS